MAYDFQMNVFKLGPSNVSAKLMQNLYSSRSCSCNCYFVGFQNLGVFAAETVAVDL